VEKQVIVNVIIVCGCACTLFNLACKLHLLCTILYCHLWPVYHIFPLYLKHDMIFGEKLLNIKCVLILSAALSVTLLILRRI
jgi:hypothetical protein